MNEKDEEKKEESTEEKQSSVEETPEVIETNIDYKEMSIRAQADYQNLQKEMEKKRKEWVEFANLGLLTDLIPVIEHFHQGIKYIPEEVKKENWMVGFLAIQKQLEEFMNNASLHRMDPVGKPFDPELHEAVSTRTEEGKESGVVVEEVMGGYMLYGKVVQPAKVIISE